MTDPILSISCNKIPNVLLLGNGINRAFGFSSWDGLLNPTTDSKSLRLDGVPYQLQAVILTNDNVDVFTKEISSELCKMKACDEEEVLLRQLSMMDWDAILTTNYTYELEKAIFKDFKIASEKTSKYRKYAIEKAPEFAKKQLHAYFEVPNMDKPIWHIHGEAARPNTMILGHYYYGKLLSSMQSYLSSVIARYDYCRDHELEFECRSWVDYFLIGNVTIIGLGLDFSEFDLWWLINAKKRKFPNTTVTLYKPDITEQQELLAKSYNVNVVKSGFENVYKMYYLNLLDSI